MDPKDREPMAQWRLAVQNESDNEHRKALKEAAEKCSETLNRAMLSLLVVALFCLLTTFGAADPFLAGTGGID